MASLLATSAAAAPMMTLAEGSNAAHITGQVFSCILALVIVAGALGMVLSRKLIHSALSLLLVMVGIAVEYAILNAPFLFAVQIVVYAGAIIVMFLFIVMMVGTAPETDWKEPIKGHRVASIIISLAIAIILAVAISLVSWKDPANFDALYAKNGGNIVSLGLLIFDKYILVFEVLSALLIVAAVGAIILTMRTRFQQRRTQREFSEARFQAYAERGVDVGAMPGAGVYASSNAMDVPALLPDGSEAMQSLNDALIDRNEYRSARDLANNTAATYKALDDLKAEEE